MKIGNCFAKTQRQQVAALTARFSLAFAASTAIWATSAAANAAQPAGIFANLLPPAEVTTVLPAQPSTRETIVSSSPELTNILQQSLFNRPHLDGFLTPPTSGLPRKWIPYDPVLISAVATLSSRVPGKTKRNWEPLVLEPTMFSQACPLGIDATISRGRGEHTFIILPGSFATLKRGSFTNQTAVYLQATFDDPTIIALPGYLSPDYLKSCNDLPWNASAHLVDLYLRLEHTLGNSNPAKTGIVGFSGGGFQTLGLLAVDAARANDKRRANPLFGLGGMAFSPILDAETAFFILDNSYKRNRSIPADRGMTTLDAGNIKSIFRAAVGSLDSSALAEMWRTSRAEFFDRFINEFTYVDLVDARNAINRPLPLDRLSFETAFVELAIRGSETWSEQTRIVNARDFYGYNDMTRIIGAIQSPALIYFSDDDPVLSREWPRVARERGDVQPPLGLERVLEFVKSKAKSPNSKVTVFNPPLGGHTGALVDPVYCRLLSSFFNGRSCPELQQ